MPTCSWQHFLREEPVYSLSNDKVEAKCILPEEAAAYLRSLEATVKTARRLHAEGGLLSSSDKAGDAWWRSVIVTYQLGGF